MRHYDFNAEYLRGRRSWLCPFVGRPCSLGYEPHCSGCRGEYAEVDFWGCTAKMFAYLECFMREEKRDILKEKVALAGGKIDEDDEGNIVSEDEAVKTLIDPLHKFPYDEPFMTAEEVRLAKADSDKIRTAIAEGKAQALPEVLSYLWDEEREQAALHGDDVQKRAALNDYLWLNYKKWMRTHKHCSVDRLKHFVEIDMARTPLYPSPSIPAQSRMLEERFKFEKENGLPKTRVSPLLPPPTWYLDHLRKENRLEKYMAKVGAVINRKVDDIPE